MRNRWGKGEPVNLADLLRITPVANEIVQLSEELNISVNDLIWIVNQIIDNNEDDESDFDSILSEDAASVISDEEWDELDIDNLENEVRQGKYMISVKINSNGKIPEIGFKAGINEKNDINYFFDMVVEMLYKLE
ncbi:MAG: hypothetical protein LBR98_04610 [Syntrophomonadaceae bacterium]|jgi:DNA-binding protein YbaB|nr:hypothetical protein [Syntrophomonadaceae bacterium]